MDLDIAAWRDSARSALAGWWDDLVAAGRFLTRLPLTGLSSAHTGLLARSMRAFPLVGVVVGLADTADGLGGGEGRAGKLAIMRDSRSGAYGVLALVFSVTLRAAALTVLT